MSMIGNTLLNKIIKENKVFDPAEILEQLKKEIIVLLKQNQGKNRDSMDISLVVIEKIDESSSKVNFAGAKRPLFLIKNSSTQVDVIKGTRSSIGINLLKNREVVFSNNEFILEKDSMIYLTSDGFVDQNNPQGKKLGTSSLINCLSSFNSSMSMSAQKDSLADLLDAHQGNAKQRDDITLMGIKI